VAVTGTVVEEYSVLVLRLVFRNRQQTGEMIDPARTYGTEYRWHLSSDQTGWRRSELLNATQLSPWSSKRRVAKIEVMYRQLLVEPPIRVRWIGKNPEYDLVVVPHQIAAHDMTARIEALKLRGKQELWGGQCTGSEDYSFSLIKCRYAGVVVGNDDTSYSAALHLKPGGHGIDPQSEAAAD
jgi:hypothetical protein